MGGDRSGTPQWGKRGLEAAGTAGTHGGHCEIASGGAERLGDFGDLRPAQEATARPANANRPELRPYQTAAIGCVQAEWDRGIRSTLLVLPTGCGKTVVFAELARIVVETIGRVLVIAHRGELLDQAARKLGDVGVDAGVEQAERRAGRARVVVASVATLKGKRLRQYSPTEFALVIIDEGHHAPAASYQAVLDRFATARVLGVTATAARADGKALGETFESVAYRYELRDAIRDGWLVPIRARRIFVESINLAAVKSRAGDLAQDELAAAMATDEAILGVVIPVLELAGGRRTIVFGVDVAHARALTLALNERKPGSARLAHGEMSADERAQVLTDFRAGAIQFLVNCALYTEGFDEPSVSCIVCARPTKSWALYVQMVGRGTRLVGLSIAESIGNGKPDMLLLDVAGNSGRHKLVGPIDALAAGAVDDQVRGEAERMLADGDQDLEGLEEAATAELERRRRAIRESAHVSYFARDVDPFFGDQLGEPCLEPWAAEPATAIEREQLEHLGLKRLPAGLTRGEAQRILSADRDRRKAGLCSYRQWVVLGKFSVDARAMTKSQAGTRISILAQNDWDPVRCRPKLAQLAANEILLADKLREAPR